MQASLYDWIVYQRRYKAKERKGERKTGGAVGSYKYQEDRQGASSKRANGSVAEYGRNFVRSFYHVTLGLLSSTNAVTIPLQCMHLRGILWVFFRVLFYWIGLLGWVQQELLFNFRKKLNINK